MSKSSGIEDLNLCLELATEELDNFLQDPRKAQEIFFAILMLFQNGKVKEDTDGNLYPSSLEALMPGLLCYCTPIEAIFSTAFEAYVLEKREFEEKAYYFLEDQHEVFIGKKRYVVDFFNEEANLIIECDGHEFHQKTKEQVTKDNEREYDLKMAGYNILRFSGSQIYNRPFECAEKAYLYIEKIMQEKGK